MLKKQLPQVYYAIYYVESELKQPVQWECFVLCYPSSRGLSMCAGNYNIKCSSMEIFCEDYRTYVFSVYGTPGLLLAQRFSGASLAKVL